MKKIKTGACFSKEKEHETLFRSKQKHFVRSFATARRFNVNQTENCVGRQNFAVLKFFSYGNKERLLTRYESKKFKFFKKEIVMKDLGQFGFSELKLCFENNLIGCNVFGW